MATRVVMRVKRKRDEAPQPLIIVELGAAPSKRREVELGSFSGLSLVGGASRSRLPEGIVEAPQAGRPGVVAFPGLGASEMMLARHRFRCVSSVAAGPAHREGRESGVQAHVAAAVESFDHELRVAVSRAAEMVMGTSRKRRLGNAQADVSNKNIRLFDVDLARGVATDADDAPRYPLAPGGAVPSSQGKSGEGRTREPEPCTGVNRDMPDRGVVEAAPAALGPVDHGLPGHSVPGPKRSSRLASRRKGAQPAEGAGVGASPLAVARKGGARPQVVDVTAELMAHYLPLLQEYDPVVAEELLASARARGGAGGSAAVPGEASRGDRSAEASGAAEESEYVYDLYCWERADDGYSDRARWDGGSTREEEGSAPEPVIRLAPRDPLDDWEGHEEYEEVSDSDTSDSNAHEIDYPDDESDGGWQRSRHPAGEAAWFNDEDEEELYHETEHMAHEHGIDV
eukprot:jgi/Mesvir1/26984/Mv20697-RA.1